MARPKQHPIHRYSVVIDADLERARSAAKAASRAMKDNSSKTKVRAFREAVSFCAKLCEVNDRGMRRSVDAMLYEHFGSIDALKQELENAGVSNHTTTAEAIVTIGFHCHLLPMHFLKESFIEPWLGDERLSWNHWLAFARTRVPGIPDYPLTYWLMTVADVATERNGNPTRRTEELGEYTFLIDDFIDAIENNGRCVRACLDATLANNLSPRQVILKLEKLTRSVTDAAAMSPCRGLEVKPIPKPRYRWKNSIFRYVSVRV